MPPTFKIPLLKDHHSHPLFYAALAQVPSLESVTDKQTANDIIHNAAQPLGNGAKLTVANGWRSNLFQWSQDELEALPPVAIFNLSLHSLLINQRGREILFDRYGAITRKLDDRVWYENNLRVVLNWFANLYASVEGLKFFYDRLQQNGVYYAEEMLLVDEGEIQIFEAAKLLDRTRFWAAPDTFAGLSEKAKDHVHGLKLFTDGAIGSSTAALQRPFKDARGNLTDCGMLIYSDEELTATIQNALATEKSLAIHAIGDRAIEQVINTLEKPEIDLGRIPEVRIEHAQLITAQQAERAKELGVILSVQPNFSQDTVDYADRLDRDYCLANNPFRMLIDQAGFVPGQDLILGSDGMPHGVEFAINQSLFPSLDTQRLTVDEFIAGYCFEDHRHGTIELSLEPSKVLVQSIVLIGQ